ncbi:MAG TPA: hypothetical protein VF711_13325 [Acidimicrobiales bacterium]
MELLDLAGYVLAALTVVVLTATLGAPVLRHGLLILRLRRDLKTIDSTVVRWSRDHGSR